MVIWFLSILRNVDGKVKMNGPCGLNCTVQGPKVEGHVWNWTICESKRSWYPNRLPQHFLTVYFLATELLVQLPVVRPMTNHIGSKDRPLSSFFMHFGPDSSKPTISLRRFCPQRLCPQSSDDQISIPSRRFVYLEVVMADGGWIIFGPMRHSRFIHWVDSNSRLVNSFLSQKLIFHFWDSEFEIDPF